MKICPYLLCFSIGLLGAGNVIAEQATQTGNAGADTTTQWEHAQSGESTSITAIKKPTLKKPASLPQDNSLIPQLLQVGLGLLFVLGMIVSLAWLFRRFGQQQYTVKGDFRVVGGVHLGTREKVVLLQMGKQQLLLGVAPGRVNILHVLEEPLDLNSAAPIGDSAFAKKLASLLQGKTR